MTTRDQFDIDGAEGTEYPVPTVSGTERRPMGVTGAVSLFLGVTLSVLVLLHFAGPWIAGMLS